MHVRKSDFSLCKNTFFRLTADRVNLEHILSLQSYRVNCQKYHKGNVGAGAILVCSFGIWLAGVLPQVVHVTCKGAAFAEILELIKAA